jgi:hypothetical protein
MNKEERAAYQREYRKRSKQPRKPGDVNLRKPVNDTVNIVNSVALLQQQMVALQLRVTDMEKRLVNARVLADLEEVLATKPSKPIYETEQTALGPRIVLSGGIHPVSKDCSRVHVRDA